MSQNESPSVLLAAARLIEGAVSLIEMHGWWNGTICEEAGNLHCAATSLDAAGVFFDAPAYQVAFDAVYEEIPQWFRSLHGPTHSRYSVLTLFNDEHDREYVLALLRTAAGKLSKEATVVST